jgi:hypothetical protein
MLLHPTVTTCHRAWLLQSPLHDCKSQPSDAVHPPVVMHCYTTLKHLSRPCASRLQSPLQPLQDNLESTTYETFERDGRKYEQYLLAIEAALVDRVPSAEAETTEVVSSHNHRADWETMESAVQC